jgi:signal transduction histidine kinase
MAPDPRSDLDLRRSRAAGTGHDSRITELTEANRRLKRKLFDLYTLFEISRNLSGLLETDRLLDHLLLTAIGQMGTGAATVIIDRQETDLELSLWRCKGLVPPKGTRVRMAKADPLLTRLETGRTPLSRKEAEALAHSPAERQLLGLFEAEMVCPMLLKEKIRGVLIVSRRLSGGAFTENDKEFLGILINHFAVAVDNARLYESERDAHQRLREAQAQLLHSEKLAAMGRLSATIAHEVNNPLGIIKNYLHLLRREVELPQAGAGHLQIVTEEVNRIAEIVRRLLDFHRPTTPGLHELDLWQVIDDCLKLMSQSHAVRHVEVVLPEVREPAPVRANGEELKQVFLNLFMNALDAMPDGGRLSVQILRRRTSLLVQIGDTGPGVAPEHMPKLFEPFFTTKADGQGTGLGLYVCYGIIKRHGGRISVRNRPGAGALFNVRLPLWSAP